MKRGAAFDQVKNVLWALFFAIALWMVMARSEQIAQRFEGVALVVQPPNKRVNVGYNTPNNLPPRSGEIYLIGARPVLAGIDAGKLVATYAIPEGTPMGPFTCPVRDFDFASALPPGVTVDKSALTQVVRVELAELGEAQLKIEPDIDRKLPDPWAWRIDRIECDPQTLNASGPREVMEREKLSTQKIILQKLLERDGFDPGSRLPKTVEQQVLAHAPPGSKISVETRPVTVRITVVPRPLEKEVPVAPAFYFEGPGFAGFPYRLRLAPGQPDEVLLKVSGPENDLAEGALEKTKSQFLVFVRIPADLARDPKVSEGAAQPFDVVVVPPQGITVSKILKPEDGKLRYYIDPAREGAPLPGGK